MSKSYKKDPYYDREKEKYDKPIPSRELIIQYLEDAARPLTKKHLIKAFDLKEEDELEALRRRLIAMERDGQIMSNRRGQYALVKNLELVRGIVVGRPEGYGFLIPDDGSPDLYLSSFQMRLVFPHDLVLARISNIDNRGRKEGAIVEVLERNTQQVVGYYREEGGICYVEPEKTQIQQIVLIPREETKGAKQTQIVVAEIVEQPTLKRQATGKIVEILGEHMAPGLEIDVAIRSYELPYLWSEDILNEVKKVPQIVTEQEVAQRKDLRALSFVTIDGEDAKDFDDAVYCERTQQGYKLYVAIADVTHYLKNDTALEKEAIDRGNSVYFPNRVIPMLPEELSNGICSLRPKVDRMVMVCEMDVSLDGQLQHYTFYEAVINSKERLTYTEVAQMIADKKTEHSDLNKYIQNLYQLYQKLIKQRLQRGALDFETVETRIIFGKDRKIDKIVPVQRNEAHKLIEECMLLANVATAEYLTALGIPILYRIHKTPDAEKLEKLRTFLQSVGLRLSGKDHPTPMDYAKLLKKIVGRPDAHIIQTVLLRSLRQALYSPVNEGHFGLAFDNYCHFTSPIRRYPDVLIHRALKHAIKGGSPEKFEYNIGQLYMFGDHCSMTERRADDATRDVTNWLKCEYMLDKVGEEFPGIVSGVTGFGIFVELKDIYVEGLVHVTALRNDYYHFDPITNKLTGKRSNVVYGLGDVIQVKVVRVDLDQKQIDFDLVNGKQKNLKPKPKNTYKKAKKKKS